MMFTQTDLLDMLTEVGQLPEGADIAEAIADFKYPSVLCPDVRAVISSFELAPHEDYCDLDQFVRSLKLVSTGVAFFREPTASFIARKQILKYRESGLKWGNVSDKYVIDMLQNSPHYHDDNRSPMFYDYDDFELQFHWSPRAENVYDTLRVQYFQAGMRYPNMGERLSSW